jgi:hypothetical protein
MLYTSVWTGGKEIRIRKVGIILRLVVTLMLRLLYSTDKELDKSITAKKPKLLFSVLDIMAADFAKTRR